MPKKRHVEYRRHLEFLRKNLFCKKLFEKKDAKNIFNQAKVFGSVM
jgi:hypothetical protein